MSQRYTDNIKKPKSKENLLGIIKTYAFSQKIEQRATGRGERCGDYVSINENTPGKLLHLPLKSCCNFTQWFKEGHSRSIVVT